MNEWKTGDLLKGYDTPLYMYPAFFSKTLIINYDYRLPRHFSVFQVEKLAISKACDYTGESDPSLGAIAITTDSQMTIQACFFSGFLYGKFCCNEVLPQYTHRLKR